MDWLEEAITLLATPTRLRTQSVAEFAKSHDVPLSTLYYHLSKEENKKRILELTLNKAKNHAPDVLDVLIREALKGDIRAIDIYLDSILKLAKNLDVKSDGKQIVFMPAEIAAKNGVELGSDTDTSSEQHS